MTMVGMARYLPRLGEQSEAGAPAHAGRALYRSHILVVDDDLTSARLVRRLLKRHGFRTVEMAGSGREALDIVFDRTPDVVVLDVHMPGTDGLEVVRQIRTVEPACIASMSPGIVAMSGDNDPATRRAMLAAGADDYIARPYDPTELALRVRYLAEKILRYRAIREYANDLEARLRDLARDIEALGRDTRGQPDAAG
jgi:putative two-component system response regulator